MLSTDGSFRPAALQLPKAWGYFAVGTSLLNQGKDWNWSDPWRGGELLLAFSAGCRLFQKRLCTQRLSAELNTVVIEWIAVGCLVLQTEELRVSAGPKIWMGHLKGML